MSDDVENELGDELRFSPEEIARSRELTKYLGRGGTLTKEELLDAVLSEVNNRWFECSLCTSYSHLHRRFNRQSKTHYDNFGLLFDALNDSGRIVALLAERTNAKIMLTMKIKQELDAAGPQAYEHFLNSYYVK